VGARIDRVALFGSMRLRSSSVAAVEAVIAGTVAARPLTGRRFPSLPSTGATGAVAAAGD